MARKKSTATAPEAGAEAAIGAEDRTQLLAWYRAMLEIRGFEDRIQALFLKGEVHGTTHLCSGQEAVPVGVGSALEPGDRVAGTYRGHGHALACGVGLQELFDEMLGRASGVNGGRAGSMNVTSLAHGYLGSYGIVGASIGAALGAALARRGEGGLAVAYFGDGATNQGYFFEGLNFAAIYDLPVLLVCENNLYMEYTLTTEVSGGTILDRASSVGVHAEAVDGMQVWDVAAATSRAAARAREGGGPTLLEARTYRFVGHSRSDPARYRPEGELGQWRRRDPIALCRQRLQAGGVEAEQLDAVAAEVAQRLVEIEAAALAAPWPRPEELPGQYAGGAPA